MKIRKIKYISIVIAPMLILGLVAFLSLNKMPERIYLDKSQELEYISLPNTKIINKLNYKKDKVNVNFLGIFPVKSIAVTKINDLEVYPGGTSVGVRLNTKGVLVVGHSQIETANGTIDSPAKVVGIELGDILTSINEKEIENSKDLARKIKEIESSTVSVGFLRDGILEKKDIELVRENGENKLGLWVRDSTAGIGTLTFYHKETGVFGALGHPITDGDTNSTFIIKEGQLLESSVISVRKGEKGSPGELKGLFVNEKQSIATIDKNTQSGIFGETNEPLINSVYNKPMKVGYRSDIKEGPATIITTLDENGPKEYDIEIVKLLQQDKSGPKSMVIKVTDKELLDKTGGIVQGMSGSPIIQNNKIIGAVTHVLINKPDVGYGIYIEWMLKDSGVIN